MSVASIHHSIRSARKSFPNFVSLISEVFQIKISINNTFSDCIQDIYCTRVLREWKLNFKCWLLLLLAHLAAPEAARETARNRWRMCTRRRFFFGRPVHGLMSRVIRDVPRPSFPKRRPKIYCVQHHCVRRKTEKEEEIEGVKKEKER